VQKGICLIIMLIGVLPIFAQEKTIGKLLSDSTKVARDTIKPADKLAKMESILAIDSSKLRLQFFTKTPIPKRAALYNALLPGLGQVYNKQYWKLSILYGGFTAAGILINRQYKNYNKFQTAYIYRTDNNPSTIDTFELKGLYSANDLLSQRTQARSSLDKLGVYTTVWYFLGIVDAMASAHLRNFDISKDLSLKPMPVLNQNFAGIKIIVSKKY
jgi:Family of unknown function (DUF5683)